MQKLLPELFHPLDFFASLIKKSWMRKTKIASSLDMNSAMLKAWYASSTSSEVYFYESNDALIKNIPVK